MKTQEIVRTYRATAGKSFAKGSAYVLQGACETYELWRASNLEQKAFAIVLEKSGDEKSSSIRQYLSHVDWALNVLADEVGVDVDDVDVFDIMTKYKTMGALRSARYPKEDKPKVSKPKVVKPVFDAKRQAKQMKKELTRKQIAELVAELLA